MLDRVGLQHLYRDCSFILSIRILRSVNLSLFVLLILIHCLLGIWITASTTPYITGKLFYGATWSDILGLTGIALSMTVNALVVGLIVFRILKVFRNVNPASDKRILGPTSESKLRSMIFVLVESGMILFSIQLVRLVVANLNDWASSPAVIKAYILVVVVHEMLNVIIISIYFISFHFC